jgi:protein involved in sex pheromone biosynthesis
MKKLSLLIIVTSLLMLSSCNLPEEYDPSKKENVSKESDEQQTTVSEVDPDKIKPPTGG